MQATISAPEINPATQTRLPADPEFRALVNPFKVGDLLYTSWGYDETHDDFAQIVAVGKRSVTIRRIRSEVVGPDSWSGRNVRPVRDGFLAPKADARPMLILAPMHPVMLVYDLDQTEGPNLPEELRDFGLFGGVFDERWLTRLVENANRYRIEVEFKPLSTTNAGFVMLGDDGRDWKMRIVVHDQLDGPSRFGVLCHELAHVLLGHLGGDLDRWWPTRPNLGRSTVEVEAEAVACVVTTHLGMEGPTHAYIARHLKGGQVPPGVSLDMIGKRASLIERMATERLPARERRSKVNRPD